MPNTLKSITGFLEKQEYPSEVIVVDDGSTDGTLTIDYPETSPPIQDLRWHQHTENLGKGAAVKTGVTDVRAENVLITDADNSTPIEELPKLLHHITQYPIVIGSRHLPGSDIQVEQPWYRKLISRLGNKFIQLLLVPGIQDTQCGFKLIRTDLAKRAFSHITTKGWGFDIELLHIARLWQIPVKEVPVKWLNSPHSRVRPLKDAFRTLGEAVQIKRNDYLGKYERDKKGLQK